MNRPTRAIALLAAVAAAALLNGCATPNGQSRLHTIDFASECTTSDTLLVMLPGLRDQARDFDAKGLVAAVQEANGGVDVVAVDAHLGYYMDRTLIDRLRADVIEPAKARGYRSIWLAGTSLGGLGSLLYSEEHPDQIDRVFLLAPYLGDPSTADKVAGEGGLSHWRAAASRMQVHERRAWGWLQRLSRQYAGDPELYLGYGRLDRYAKAHDLVAEAMEPARVVEGAGGHNWSTWAELWRSLGRDRQAFAGAACR